MARIPIRFIVTTERGIGQPLCEKYKERNANLERDWKEESLIAITFLRRKSALSLVERESTVVPCRNRDDFGRFERASFGMALCVGRLKRHKGIFRYKIIQ